MPAPSWPRWSATRPGILAFVGKRAAQEVLGRPVGYGPQDVRVGVSEVWVVPSTSGAARGSWDLEPWLALARLALLE